MRRRVALATLLAFGWVMVASAMADEPQPIPEEQAKVIASLLILKADKLPKPPIRFQADPEKANGLYNEDERALMVVPRSDLKEEETDEVTRPKGAPVGYLFLHGLTILANGKAVQTGQIPMVSFTDDSGVDREVYVLRLAVKKFADDDWRLLVFSKKGKPIVMSRFRAEENGSDLPLTAEVKDIKDKARLVITLFGKYAADVRLGLLY